MFGIGCNNFRMIAGCHRDKAAKKEQRWKTNYNSVMKNDGDA